MQWLPQLINAAYNVTVGLVLGLAFHRWQTGGTAMLSGFTIGELVMYSQPRALPDQWRNYLAGQIILPPSPPVNVSMLPSPAGLTLQLAF